MVVEAEAAGIDSLPAWLSIFSARNCRGLIRPRRGFLSGFRKNEIWLIQMIRRRQRASAALKVDSTAGRCPLSIACGHIQGFDFRFDH
jgi:hypothetical protein